MSFPRSSATTPPVPRCLPAISAAALLVVGIGAAAPAIAQPADALARLEAAIEAQRRELARQSNDLAEQRRRLAAQERELQALRTRQPAPARAAAVAPTPPAVAPTPPAVAPAAPAARVGAAAEAEAAQRRDERRVVDTDPGLARVGGVLLPRGTLSLEPSIDYAYSSQNRAFVSGFTIIPGITFGSVDIREVQRRTLTAAATFRYGLTDRIEINARIPYIYRTDTIRTQPADVDASPITIGPDGTGIGDIEFGGSWQLNQGRGGWPVLVGNLRVKSDTGRSPFDVPIWTTADAPDGPFLRGLERRLPTGTGFWSVEPGLTLIYPTDPAVLFASVRYIWNIGRTVALQSEQGGAAIPASLDPGDGVGLNVGLGFALNETTSFSIGYEHVHVLPSLANGRRIAGSSYDVGTFNFGLSHRLSDRLSMNVGVSVGATGNAPDMRLLVRLPYRLSLF
jgi:hypothetical protein